MNQTEQTESRPQVELTWLSTSIAMSINISCSSRMLFSNFIISWWRASISANVFFAACVSMTIYTRSDVLKYRNLTTILTKLDIQTVIEVLRSTEKHKLVKLNKINDSNNFLYKQMKSCLWQSQVFLYRTNEYEG